MIIIIKNSDISSVEKIYNKIYAINRKFDEISRDSHPIKIVPVFFASNVKFVNPLFWSLLLVIYDKYRDNNVFLVIDIINLNNQKTNLKDNRQHHILRFLLQYIDIPYFEIVNKGIYNEKLEDYIYVENQSIEQRYDEYTKIITLIDGRIQNMIYDKLKNSVIVSGDQKENKQVVIYCSKAHGDSIFQEKGNPFSIEELETPTSFRHILPIFKISNFPFFALEDIHYNEEGKNLLPQKELENKFNTRKNIYKTLLLTDDGYDKEETANTLSKMLTYIRPSKSTKSSLDGAFKTLFIEMIDNIKRHALDIKESNVNSYFNFYHDEIAKQFRFTIIDDSHKGFLNTYLETLKKEIVDILKDVLPDNEFDINNYKEIIKNYCNNINENHDKQEALIHGYCKEISLIENDFSINDKKILKDLFNIDGAFLSHQIPRLVMHFGIPVLMDLIDELEGNLYIRLHRRTDSNQLRYYEIIINEYTRKQKGIGKTDSIVDVKEITDGLPGTYIYIEVPSYNKPREHTIKPFEPTTEEYSLILDNQEEVKRNISKFIDINNISEGDKHAILDYKKHKEKYPKNTIGDALREIYKASYCKGLQDVLVINFPLLDNRQYLQVLIKILYNEKHTLVSRYPVNIIYLDAITYDMAFIGGKDRNEFCTSNQIIQENYQSGLIVGICNNVRNPSPANSDFFYKLEGSEKWHLLPLSQFENSLTSENYFKALEKKDIHIDVGNNKHIGQFFNFKKQIENSVWDKKIAFYFANELDRKYRNNKIVFIGMGKYAAVTISRIQKILGMHEHNRFFIYSKKKSIEHERQSKKLNDFVKKNERIIIFSPILVTGNGIKNLLECLEEENKKKIKKIINTVRLNTGISQSISTIDINTFLEISKDKIEMKEAEKCTLCFPKKIEDEKPLYTLETTGFYPKNYFEDNFDPKIIEYGRELINNRWGNIICTGHIEKTNHYYFYIKTIDFLERNHTEVKNWLSKVSIENPKGKNIIFSPIRESNNRFMVMVETEIFGGDATVYRFDRKMSDQNLYNINDLKIYDNDKVYFVDDEVDTGATIEYFYRLLRHKNSNIKFEKIITLLDRVSREDMCILSNFITNKIEDNYLYFLSTVIQPIKTHDEECYLCSRRKKYIDYFKKCTIDLNRYQFLERIIKLQDTSASDLKDDISGDSIKKFIKFYMVELMYKSKSFNYPIRELTNVIKSIKHEYKDEIEIIKSHLNHKESNSFEKYLNDSVSVEFRIAYFKALSFPKLVYNKVARQIVHAEVINSIIKQQEEQDYRSFSKNSVTVDSKLIEKLKNIPSGNHIIGFVIKERKRIDLLNVLFSTAGYLDIKYLLSKPIIRFYQKIFRETEGNDIIKDKMYIYPFSIKMITSERPSSAKIFDKNLKKVLGEELNRFKTDKYTKLRAMFLENIYAEEESIDIDKEGKIEDLVKKIASIDRDNKIIKVNIYVNQNYTIEYNTMEEYMLKSSLVNIENFSLADKENTHEKEYMVYNGVFMDNGLETSIDYSGKNNVKNMRDVWANWCIEDEKKILIRLVDIDIENLDVKQKNNYMVDFKNRQLELMDETKAIVPIGVIAIKFNNKIENFAEKIRKLLILNGDVVDYLKEKLSSGVIQEAIAKQKIKDGVEEEIEKRTSEIARKIYHSVKDYIDISTTIERKIGDPKILENTMQYVKGIKYMSSIAMVTLEDDCSTKICDVFFDEDEYSDFYREIQDFIEVAYVFDNNFWHNVSKETLKIICSDTYPFELMFNEDKMRYFIFEFIFNALRAPVKTIETPRIVIEEKKDKLIIMNSLDEKHFKVAKENIENDNSTRVGMPSVRLAIIKNKYKMEITYNKQSNMIQIEICKGDKDAKN